jgi:hypothetical protein
MAAIVIWMFALSVSVSALLILAAAVWQEAHLGVSMIIALFVAASTIRDQRNLAANGAGEVELAASGARAMGFLWCWSAMVVLLTYTWLLNWPKSTPILIVLIFGSAVCLFVSSILGRAAKDRIGDANLVSLVDWMAWGQLLFTCVALGSLYAAGRLSVEGFTHKAKWAAINVSMASAIGIAMIAAYMLSQRSQAQAEVS